jgi:DNA-binding MltR family transcriptional regulator
MAKAKSVPSVPGLNAVGNQVFKELDEESDRGTALLGAEFLNAVLEALLRAHLVDDKKKIDSLLRVDGPLGTFSARIKTSYCLGLIGPKMYRDLERIREVRNAFAHCLAGQTFETASIKGRCEALETVRLVRPQTRGGRNCYKIAVTSLYMHIALRALGTQRQKEGEDFKLAARVEV